MEIARLQEFIKHNKEKGGTFNKHKIRASMVEGFIVTVQMAMDYGYEEIVILPKTREELQQVMTIVQRERFSHNEAN